MNEILTSNFFKVHEKTIYSCANARASGSFLFRSMYYKIANIVTPYLLRSPRSMKKNSMYYTSFFSQQYGLCAWVCIWETLCASAHAWMWCRSRLALYYSCRSTFQSISLSIIHPSFSTFTNNNSLHVNKCLPPPCNRRSSKTQNK